MNGPSFPSDNAVAKFLGHRDRDFEGFRSGRFFLWTNCQGWQNINTPRLAAMMMDPSCWDICFESPWNMHRRNMLRHGKIGIKISWRLQWINVHSVESVVNVKWWCETMNPSFTHLYNIWHTSWTWFSLHSFCIILDVFSLTVLLII